MKSAFLPLLLLTATGARAQRSTWDVHPLSMVPCAEWINPAPGCGGCSSCRTSVDSDPQVMEGGALQWSSDLVLCPHPVDTLGNNTVIVNNWPVEPEAASYLYGRVFFHQPMRIDTVELTCAMWSPGTNQVELAIQFNETDPLTTTTILSADLSGSYQHFTVTDLGAVPMMGNGIGYANFFVRTAGTDAWLLFKGLRVVASEDEFAAVAENDDDRVFILPHNGGVTIASPEPVDAFICDASGRTTWRGDALHGTTFVPLAPGLSIVRAGSRVRRVVR
jgi:hypothetical protein